MVPRRAIRIVRRRPTGVRWRQMRPIESGLREIYRRELLPAPARWWLAADGMHAWYAMLRRGLEAPLGGREAAEREIAKAAGKAYTRRWGLLRARFPALPDDVDAPARVLGALSFTSLRPKGAWVFRALGKPPLRKRDQLRVEGELRTIPIEERWREVTTHLGEVLIELTRTLPSVIPGRTRCSARSVSRAAGAPASTRGRCSACPTPPRVRSRCSA